MKEPYLVSPLDIFTEYVKYQEPNMFEISPRVWLFCHPICSTCKIKNRCSYLHKAEYPIIMMNEDVNNTFIKKHPEYFI